MTSLSSFLSEAAAAVETFQAVYLYCIISPLPLVVISGVGGGRCRDDPGRGRVTARLSNFMIGLDGAQEC